MNDPKLVKLQPPKIDLRKYNGLNRMGLDNLALVAQLAAKTRSVLT